MDASKALVVCYVLMGLGGLGAVGAYYFKHVRDAEKERRKSIPQLHVRSLRVFYVQRSDNVYQLGVVAHILNKDATRAVVVNSIAFDGRFRAFGTQDASIALVKVSPEGVSRIHGDWYLPAGRDIAIKFELEQVIEMIIQGPGTPGIAFDGSWTVSVEGTEFNLLPSSTVAESVLTPEKWDALSTADLR